MLISFSKLRRLDLDVENLVWDIVFNSLARISAILWGILGHSRAFPAFSQTNLSVAETILGHTQRLFLRLLSDNLDPGYDGALGLFNCEDDF